MGEGGVRSKTRGQVLHGGYPSDYEGGFGWSDDRELLDAVSGKCEWYNAPKYRPEMQGRETAALQSRSLIFR